MLKQLFSRRDPRRAGRIIAIGAFVAAPMLLGDACNHQPPSPPPVDVHVGVTNAAAVDLQGSLSYGGSTSTPPTVIDLGVIAANSKQTVQRTLPSLALGTPIHAKASYPLGALVDDESQSVSSANDGTAAPMTFSLVIRGNYFDENAEEQQLENAFGDLGKVQHGAFPAAMGLAQAFHNVLGSVEIFDPATTTNPYGTVALIYSPATLGHIYSETTALFSGESPSSKSHLSQTLEAKAAVNVPAILQFGLNGGGSTEYEFDTTINSLGPIGTSDDTGGSLLTVLRHLPMQDRQQICNRLANDSAAILIHVTGLYGFQSASFNYTQANKMNAGDTLAASSFATQTGTYTVDQGTTKTNPVGPTALNVSTETPDKSDICPAILNPLPSAAVAISGTSGALSTLVSTPIGARNAARLVGIELPGQIQRLASHKMTNNKVKIVYTNVALPRNAIKALSALAHGQ